jgi:1,2-diacylglycerol 3-alpha-glucosyltransferase/glucuronosyltransferase
VAARRRHHVFPTARGRRGDLAAADLSHRRPAGHRKNVEAFLKLDLPGTKLVVGDGPARAQLAKAYPDAVFLGSRQGEALAEIYAAADVFVFPSRTDTFGLVLLEALASGVPVAAFPAAAPCDVIGEAPVGALDEDLQRACLAALEISRDDCRDFALRMTWEESARIFLEHVANATHTAMPEKIKRMTRLKQRFRRGKEKAA